MPNGSAIRTLVFVGLIAVGAALLVTGSYELSHERIAANERERLLRSLSSVLDPDLRSRDLAPTHLSVADRELLGTDEPGDVFVITSAAGRPEAGRLLPTAPGGYHAPLRPLVGLSPERL